MPVSEYEKVIKELKNLLKVKDMIIGDKDDKINELRLELKDKKEGNVMSYGY